MAAETCAVCEDSVPFDAAAHVLLNPPEDPVVDGYLCPSCYDEHFEGVLQHAEAPETGDDEGDDGGDEGEGEADGDAVDDEAVEADDEAAPDESEATDGDGEPAEPVDADR
ncbi:hypothetical protein [Halomicrobium salinisoli]|uniref:hypothetical protein n=1 Tax=Halomicrobium salinisoli TaxID=2878391 RepID=UPI001CEFBB58|nr:hypothetical protein [Halomicrobium salinisoli]